MFLKLSLNSSFSSVWQARIVKSEQGPPLRVTEEPSGLDGCKHVFPQRGKPVGKLPKEPGLPVVMRQSFPHAHSLGKRTREVASPGQQVFIAPEASGALQT